MTAPGVEPVQMYTSASWEIRKLIGVKWNLCWRWHFQFMQHHPLEDSNWNKSHLEAFMPYFLPFLTRVEFLPILIWWVFSGVHILSCCCPVTKLCPTLWGATDCSMPGLPVLHCLPEFAQIHVHWVFSLALGFSGCKQWIVWIELLVVWRIKWENALWEYFGKVYVLYKCKGSYY